MKENLDITLRPEKVQFTGNCIRIADFHSGKYRIPFKEIVLACLCVCDEKSGIIYEPEITEITRDMEGELVIYNIFHCCFRLKTDLTGKTAGALFIELAMHAPYIMLGGKAWFDVENDADFAEIRHMAKLMRQC